MFRNYFATLTLAVSFFLITPTAQAQNQLPQVSMVTLQVVPNADGTQSVITPKGDLAPLPGAGTNGNTATIYMGAQGGFWYTDRTGQTISLDAAVRELQARRASQQQAVQVPQYAPAPYYQEQAQQQSSNNSNNSSSGGGGGGAVMSAVGTAAAAGVGAMAGAALSNSYYNAPYGTPMYYNNGRPCYYGEGEHQEFDDLNQNQKTALYNKHKINKQNQQQALQQSQNMQESRQQNLANRQSQMANSMAPQEHYQQQQKWYQDQLKQNPKNFQRSENNPFVSQGGREAFSERASSMRESRGGAARFGGGRRR